MSTDGILEYQGTKRVLYRGDTSNIVFDTRTTSLGIGVTGSNNPSSNLYITGNAYVSSNLAIGGVMTMGVVNVAARHNLQAVTDMGNVTTHTIEFTNPTTAFTTTGNVSDLNIVSNVNMLHTANTASIKLNSNVVTEFPRSKKLIKYPRVAMTTSPDQGYTATASSNWSGASSSPWQAFDNVWDPDGSGTNSWESANGSFASGNSEEGPRLSTGTSTFDSKNGEYLNIKLPERIVLQRIKHTTRADRWWEAPWAGFIYGSNDGFQNYEMIHSFSDIGGVSYVHIINATTAYDEYRFHVTHTQASTYLSICLFDLYGVPENDSYDQGSDVTIKSYPNVPNTDWLDIYYDGQDYTTMQTTVDNKTGVSTYDATPINGVGFDATQKAFTFNANSSQYLSSSTPISGNYVHTISMWFKGTNLTPTGGDTLMWVGDNTDNKRIEIYIENDRINYNFRTNDCIAHATFQNNRWYHLTCTYNGQQGSVGREIYVDGQLLSTSHSGNLADLNITNSTLNVGGFSGTSTTYMFSGFIANFRLFNRALTSDEVWQLYAYQKEYFGHEDLSMTLKAGRLGIGTSEPRAALDVKGEIRAVGSMFYLLDTPIQSEWYWTGSTSSTGAEIRVIYSQLPENCRAVYADVFLPQASANDHGSHTLGHDHKQIGSLWTAGRSSTTANQPTSYMTTGLSQGSNVVFINQPGQSDNHEWYYGNWWPSLTIPLAPGNVLYHGRDGFGSTSGWILVYVKGYYV